MNTLAPCQLQDPTVWSRGLVERLTWTDCLAGVQHDVSRTVLGNVDVTNLDVDSLQAEIDQNPGAGQRSVTSDRFTSALHPLGRDFRQMPRESVANAPNATNR